MTTRSLRPLSRRSLPLSLVCLSSIVLGACGSDSSAGSPGTGGASGSGGTSSGGATTTSGGASAGGGASGAGGAASGGAMGSGGTTTASGPSPTLAGCPLFPADHIFNTKIDSLPASPDSAAFLTTIGSHNLHLDLGTQTDITQPDYYGIPYNVVHGNAATWARVRYGSTDTSMTWNPTNESDCAAQSSGAAHTLVSPCTSAAAPAPVFPIPGSPLIEGGIDRDPSQPYGDHHLLLLDADTCRLWELYHVYPTTSGWDIFGSASWDLKSNALRPDQWTSADAAGFPILPLLLKADEASSGTINHALRFTIESNLIRVAYTWPARHLTSNGTSSKSLPPMGQLFRLKASYAIPASFNTQSKAILTAMKTYGMYVADGGSNMYVTGEPSAKWEDATFSQVQSVNSKEFEAVDLSEVEKRAGFDVNSGMVPR